MVQSEGGEFKRLQDILLTLNSLTNVSNKQFILPNHAYTVLKSTFKNPNNENVNFSVADLQKLDISRIDPLLSTVTIRNPHATNVEGRKGTGVPDNDGVMKDDLGRIQSLVLIYWIRLYQKVVIWSVPRLVF